MLLNHHNHAMDDDIQQSLDKAINNENNDDDDDNDNANEQRQ